MKKITAEELKTILKNHRHWLNRDCTGWEKMRANLYEADLHGADLSDASLTEAILAYSDLSDADLSGATLDGADLTGAILRHADLDRANLLCANMYKADLREANLKSTYMRDANLHGAYLTEANLCYANLRRANLAFATLAGARLIRADLSMANLYDANLYGADLICCNIDWGTNLNHADLAEAKNVPYIPMTCPEEGSFIGWKKADGKIVCLEVPEDAKRSSAMGRKCRCSKAKVLTITHINGDRYEFAEVSSYFDSSFKYKVGEMVSVDDFDENRWNECSTGIHFFMNRKEAVLY